MLVEIDDHVDAAMKVQLLVDAKVGMDPELAAASGLVIAAAVEIGVGDQALDCRQSFQKLENGARVEEVEELPRGAVAVLRQDLPLVQAGVPQVENAIGGESLAGKMIKRKLPLLGANGPG